MKVAIFSDVHGNLEALQAILEHASNEQVDRWVCLGDVVGYGANPEECVKTVRGLPGIVCVKGNHDAAVTEEDERAFFHEVALEGILFTVDHLSEESFSWLAALPYQHAEEGAFLAVHASPFHPASWEYVLDQRSAERAFDSMNGHRVAFVGHSHAPVLFSDDGAAQRMAPGDTIMLDTRQRRYVINVGSVGQPRDGNPDAAWALYDTDTSALRLFRVQYDRERAAEKILKAGLPPVLAERILVGY